MSTSPVPNERTPKPITNWQFIGPLLAVICRKTEIYNIETLYRIVKKDGIGSLVEGNSSINYPEELAAICLDLATIRGRAASVGASITDVQHSAEEADNENDDLLKRLEHLRGIADDLRRASKEG